MNNLVTATNINTKVYRFLSLVEFPLEHRQVMKAFPDSVSLTARKDWEILFRVDDNAKTLIQSLIQPDWAKLIDSGYRTKKIEIVALKPGLRLRYRLCLDSFDEVKKLRIPPEEWLLRREEKLGARFEIDSKTSKQISESSNGNIILMRQVSIEGVLLVLNGQRLQEAIARGIGKRKAYGCGLLSIAPL